MAPHDVPPVPPPAYKDHAAEEKKEPWSIKSVSIFTSLLTFIHACSVTIAKLVVKGARKALNWHYGDIVKDAQGEDSNAGEQPV
ncbi:hypothetical protein N7471_001394 [Penicillium samsonianum]|uniref:uncharacterized protein n=1 Tax=Penicillium samsonianum TaxID=1882272 RepID=UPI0025481F46|nr:uncharacterized protein N7471_001394 [Penicillium samsonianum]KAJ6150195.1 hypothetical protein N7471_001394 [Penicillium samsonianum]